jgi:hypothetical protein
MRKWPGSTLDPLRCAYPPLRRADRARSHGLEKKDARLLLRRPTEADAGRLEAVRDLLEAIAG